MLWNTKANINSTVAYEQTDNPGSPVLIARYEVRPVIWVMLTSAMLCVSSMGEVLWRETSSQHL
jgi:hypothetical protein